MKLHLWIAGAIVVAALGWAATRDWGGPSDPVFSRDRFLDSNDVTITFRSDVVYEGYRYTRLEDGTWLWERLDQRGDAFPDYIVHGKRGDLLRIADGCHVAVDGLHPPFIPGVTVAQKLTDVPRRKHHPDDSYEYDVEAGNTALQDVSGPGGLVTVTEHLATLRTGQYAVDTVGQSPAITYGTYQVRKATGEERARVRTLAGAATASENARFDVRLRVIESDLLAPVLGPYPVVVAKDCPGQPAQLYASSQGGQGPGLRAGRPDFDIGADASGGPVLHDAKPIRGSIFADRENLVAASGAVTPRDVPIHAGQLMVVTARTGALPLAVFVASCTGTSFFRC